MSKCKTKAIQTDLDTFRHNHAYPGIIQAYSKPYVTLAYLEPWYIQNPDNFRTRGIFRTLAYLEPWYIRNPRIFRTLTYSKFEAYLEPCLTSTMKRFVKTVNSYNYFHESELFLQYKPVAFSDSRNKYHEVVTPAVVIFYVKNYGARGDRDREFLRFSLIYPNNKLAYLQLITVLVQGNSPPKTKSHEKEYLKQTFSKNLEKYVKINWFLEPVDLLKMNFY